MKQIVVDGITEAQNDAQRYQNCHRKIEILVENESRNFEPGARPSNNCTRHRKSPRARAGKDSPTRSGPEGTFVGYLKEISSPFLLFAGDRSSRMSGATASGGRRLSGSSPGMAFWRMRVRKGPGFSRLARTFVPLHSAA